MQQAIEQSVYQRLFLEQLVRKDGGRDDKAVVNRERARTCHLRRSLTGVEHVRRFAFVE
jgi:hypothetical protein